MVIKRKWLRPGRSVLSGLAVCACAAATMAAAQTPAAPTDRAPRAVRFVHICRSGLGDTRLANKLSRNIETALAGRPTPVAVRVDDPRLKINCYYNASRHFYSASAVKATILAALELKAHAQHRRLTSQEKYEAYRMITQSSNSAANILWFDVGLPAMQHFLNLAGMRHTKLPPPYEGWGVTRITAHDETLLLWLLAKPNHVLTNAARNYEMYLMAHVNRQYDYWGVSAGAPTNFTVHLKNGWAPLPNYPCCSPWAVNSIGAFTNRNAARDYTMVVLTYNNSTEHEGIRTIQRVAVKVNYLLNPHARHTAPTIPAGPVPAGG